MKIGRNEPCPCGSGKKYKNCCYSKEHSIPVSQNYSIDSAHPDADYITNRCGGKIYMNETLQPKLKPLLEGVPVTYKVLSVGFTKHYHPIATIQETDRVVAYVLPDDYLDWCQTCTALAQMGTNFFPSECVFTLRDGKYYVDIL